MLLEAVLRLIDRCIQLLNVRKENRRSLLGDYVAPIYSDFENLHKDYMECFRAYRLKLASSDTFEPTHPIVDQIISDHVFTQDLRSKLDVMAEAIPHNSTTYRVDNFDLFMSSIQRYFQWAEWYIYSDAVLSLCSNDPRSCLLSGLRFIFRLDESTAEEAARMLEEHSCIWFVDQFALPVFSSEALRLHVLTQLRDANGDLNATKRILSVALVDSVAEHNQSSFTYATKHYLKVKSELT